VKGSACLARRRQRSACSFKVAKSITHQPSGVLQFDNTDGPQWFPANRCRPDAGQKNTPAVHTGRGILFQHLVRADVHETQAAPGLDVLVAISANVEGRTAVEVAVTMVMPMTMMPTMAMTMVSAVAMTTMPMTTMTTLTARRSRGHGGSTERDSGDDGE